jgi:hypothetical protein
VPPAAGVIELTPNAKRDVLDLGRVIDLSPHGAELSDTGWGQASGCATPSKHRTTSALGQPKKEPARGAHRDR